MGLALRCRNLRQPGKDLVAPILPTTISLPSWEECNPDGGDIVTALTGVPKVEK